MSGEITQIPTDSARAPLVPPAVAEATPGLGTGV